MAVMHHTIITVTVLFFHIIPRVVRLHDVIDASKTASAQ